MKRGEFIFSALVLLAMVALLLALGHERRKRGQSMYSEGIVIGTVLAIEESGDDKRPDVLLVEDRSRPEWVQKVACEFFSRSKGLLANVRQGDLVRVVGGIKSSEGRSGGWFTHYVAFAVQPLREYMTAREGQIRKQHTERKGADDEMPF